MCLDCSARRRSNRATERCSTDVSVTRRPKQLSLLSKPWQQWQEFYTDPHRAQEGEDRFLIVSVKTFLDKIDQECSQISSGIVDSSLQHLVYSGFKQKPLFFKSLVIGKNENLDTMGYIYWRFYFSKFKNVLLSRVKQEKWRQSQKCHDDFNYFKDF